MNGQTRIAAILGAALMMAPVAASAGENGIKIGVLADMSSFASTTTGAGAVLAAKLAVEDFGGKVNGKPIEVISADMQSKADLAVQIARRWYEAENVDVITNIPASAAAIAIQAMATERKRLVLATVGATTELTRSACSPYAVHWVNDTAAISRGLVGALAKEGRKSWTLLMPDYALGKAMSAAAKPYIESLGGKVIEEIYFPPNNNDFSQFLLRARASGADVIGTAAVGIDLTNLIKQASEFGILPSSKQALAAFIMNVSDIHATGLKTMQGVWVQQEFYWDESDETRAFAKRFQASLNRMPDYTHASEYSGVKAYLQAVQDAGTDEPGAVVKKMKERPNDRFGVKVPVRADGRALEPSALYQVKGPNESKQPWDYLKKVSAVSPEDLYLPPDPKTCSILR